MNHVLLINPRITSKRNARFPLSLLALAASLEGKCSCRIIDGNIDRDYIDTIRHAVRESHFDAVGITVMGGPAGTVGDRRFDRSAPRVSRHSHHLGRLFPHSIHRRRHQRAVRGLRGQRAGRGRLRRAVAGRIGGRPARARIDRWAHLEMQRQNRAQHGSAVRRPPIARHAALRPIAGHVAPIWPVPFSGQRTAAHQAALGCRFRCTFCGVAAMFRGGTALPPAARLERDLTWLKNDLGADSIQYFDHNFFDREVDMIPILEVLARDTTALVVLRAGGCSAQFIAAGMGTRAQKQTAHGLHRRGIGERRAAEEHPQGHQGRIRPWRSPTCAAGRASFRNSRSWSLRPTTRRARPSGHSSSFAKSSGSIPTSEIIVYIYTPLPASSLQANSRSRAAAATLTDVDGNPLRFPETPEEWTERRWVDYSCHADAPWMTERLRRRIRNFVTVLGCRFPTVQDVRSPSWGKTALSALAAWRYRFRRYDRPWELALSKKIIRLADPRATSL